MKLINMHCNGTVENLIRGINFRNEVIKFEIDISNSNCTKINLNLKFPYNIPVVRSFKCKEIENFLNTNYSSIGHLIYVK